MSLESAMRLCSGVVMDILALRPGALQFLALASWCVLESLACRRTAYLGSDSPASAAARLLQTPCIPLTAESSSLVCVIRLNFGAAASKEVAKVYI